MPIGAALAAAAPAIIGGVASAGVSAGIGALTKSGASGQISGGAAAANGISQAAINESRGIYKPYMDTGQHALADYASFTGLNGPDAAAAAMANFTSSPGYGYQVEQGLKGVDAGAAAKGMLRSGATLKAEQTLGANLANQDFSAYLSRLSGMAGLGLDSNKAFTNILSGQSSNQQDTTTKAAGAQAGLTDQFGNKLANAAGAGINSLAEYGSKNGWFGSTPTNYASAGNTPTQYQDGANFNVERGY